MFGDAMQLQWTASFFKFTSKLSPENVNANSLPSLNPFNFFGYRKMIIHYLKEFTIKCNISLLSKRKIYHRTQQQFWGQLLRRINRIFAAFANSKKSLHMCECFEMMLNPIKTIWNHTLLAPCMIVVSPFGNFIWCCVRVFSLFICIFSPEAPLSKLYDTWP